METANISGSIRINLTTEYARQINWGRPVFWKKPQQEPKEIPLIVQIKNTDGVSGVWYTNDKNSELLATIKVHNPDEGEKIATKISGYPGVKTVQISLGPAGPPPPPPSP
jgi:hypothetical protein